MEDKRVISKAQGEDFSHENGVQFLETSAKTNVFVTISMIMILDCPKKS